MKRLGESQQKRLDSERKTSYNQSTQEQINTKTTVPQFRNVKCEIEQSQHNVFEPVSYILTETLQQSEREHTPVDKTRHHQVTCNVIDDIHRTGVHNDQIRKMSRFVDKRLVQNMRTNRLECVHTPLQYCNGSDERTTQVVIR